MKYGSLFSGVEAAAVAWRPLGWQCQWVAEIDAFASAVLSHHYPDVPNLGDVNGIDTDAIEPVDLIVFGSPCQSFSVAGKRLGLDDPRGNMALVGLRVVGRVRPRWVVWENVPGVLSSDEGRDFGTFLGLLGELGYGFAYRVLDAQHFGVPQRRRRVFVVGHLGDWRPAAAVLFEPESLRGDPAPRRETGERVADGIAPCLDAGEWRGLNRNQIGVAIPTADDLIAATIGAENVRHTTGRESGPDLLVAYGLDCENLGDGGNVGWHDADKPSITLNTNGNIGIAHSLRADGFDASEDGTGRGTPLVAFGSDGHGAAWVSDAHPALTSQQGSETSARQFGVMTAMTVRRLAPRECERLQGFPDDYTLVPLSRAQKKAVDTEMAAYYRRTQPELSDEIIKYLAADGPRYRAIGNSFAVPVVRWIGERITAMSEATAAIGRNGL